MTIQTQNLNLPQGARSGLCMCGGSHFQEAPLQKEIKRQLNAVYRVSCFFMTVFFRAKEVCHA
jgi:hypothetical protein